MISSCPGAVRLCRSSSSLTYRKWQRRKCCLLGLAGTRPDGFNDWHHDWELPDEWSCLETITLEELQHYLCHSIGALHLRTYSEDVVPFSNYSLAGSPDLPPSALPTIRHITKIVAVRIRESNYAFSTHLATIQTNHESLKFIIMNCLLIHNVKLWNTSATRLVGITWTAKNNFHTPTPHALE